MAKRTSRVGSFRDVSDLWIQPTNNGVVGLELAALRAHRRQGQIVERSEGHAVMVEQIKSDDDAVIQAIEALPAIKDPNYRAAAFIAITKYRLEKQFGGNVPKTDATQAAMAAQAQAMYDKAINEGVISA
jgi:hypothetical protein